MISQSDSKDKAINREIGLRVKDAREKAGLSQEQLATELGVARAQLEHLEMGTDHMKAHHLYRLAQFFKVTPDYFFGRLLPQKPHEVTTQDAGYLIQNFLKVDAPSRGTLFKQFVAALTKDDSKS